MIVIRVQRFEALAPPREPDRGKPRIARRRHDIGKGEIQIPECRESRSNDARQLLQRRLPIGIEPALSDR